MYNAPKEVGPLGTNGVDLCTYLVTPHRPAMNSEIMGKNWLEAEVVIENRQNYEQTNLAPNVVNVEARMTNSATISKIYIKYELNLPEPTGSQTDSLMIPP